MRFDWYQATISEDPQVLVDTLADNLRGEVVQGRAMYGYEHGWEIRTPERTVARVLSGGRNGRPNAWASGDDTDEFVPLVRSLWPATHHVTRMDAAQDFRGAGAWDRLQTVCLKHADDLHLKVNQAGDWYRGEDGRTLYVGSKKSPVFLRLYEKGKQLSSIHRSEGTPPSARADGSAMGLGQIEDPFDPDWVRIEVVVRPSKEVRDHAARVEPEEAWGFSRWTQGVLTDAMGTDVPAVSMRTWRQPDDERAMQFAVRQYGATFERLAAEAGGWSALGEQLGQMHAERMRQKEARE